MNKLTAIILFLISAFALSTCRKKPESILIKVYNPFYDEGVAGAEISVIETKENSITKNYECQTLKHVTMNSQGEALFYDTKLRKGDKYTYVVRVSKAYDATVSNANLCGNFEGDNVIPKTNSSVSVQIIYVPPFQAGWAIKIINLNVGGFGSFSNDSISVRVFQDFGYVEGWDDQYKGSQFNGSKREIASLNLSPLSVPNNTDIVKYPESQFFPTYFGKHKVLVYKKKSGIVTSTTYTEVIRHDEFIHEFVVAW
ncbi:MAG: hypothetical protein JNJ40_14890 [Bacteroidia bacterium]|nr:hypothetical protein [Bacteroidia bacterium]